MTAAINLVGVSANYPNPGTYVEIDFAQGPASGYGGIRTCLLLGNKTSSGTATNDTVIYGPDTQTTCQTESDVITLFGAGSQLHRMFLKFTAINRTTPLYFVAVTSSSGSSASATMTIATTATSNGNLRFWCEDDFVDTPITSGQTATTIAGNVVASIKSKTRWAVTATNSSGVVTISAVEPGPESNWIRVQSLITPGTATIGTTTSLTANTFLSGGTTADSNTNALATIIATRFYYIASGDSDSTNVGALVTQVTNQAQPTTGIRQRVVYGSMDTSANVITNATGVNNPRAEVIWGTGAVDLMPSELAAFFVALYSLLEPNSNGPGVFRKNYSLFPTSATDATLWPLIPSRNGLGSAPTAATITSLLNNGVSPLTLVQGGGSSAGTVQFVKRCTTRSLNGSVNDYRIRDAHKVTICDYWADDAQAITQTQFGGKDILPDPAQGQPPPPAIAVTPGIWGGALKGLTKRYGNAGQWASTVPGVQGADTINGNAIIQAETTPPTRMSALFGLTPVNIADQFNILAQQVA